MRDLQRFIRERQAEATDGDDTAPSAGRGNTPPAVSTAPSAGRGDTAPAVRTAPSAGRGAKKRRQPHENFLEGTHDWPVGAPSSRRARVQSSSNSGSAGGASSSSRGSSIIGGGGSVDCGSSHFGSGGALADLTDLNFNVGSISGMRRAQGLDGTACFSMPAEGAPPPPPPPPPSPHPCVVVGC